MSMKGLLSLVSHDSFYFLSHCVTGCLRKKKKKQKKQKNIGSESSKKVPQKCRNESEGSPGETAQKTSRKQATQIASQKRKKFESESESSSAPKRRFSYGMEDLPSSASLRYGGIKSELL
ncbi:unnamed protein product [Rhizophagus irregularis]|nr:unnamed protein product [Rhizophagus irregularis]